MKKRTLFGYPLIALAMFAAPPISTMLSEMSAFESSMWVGKAMLYSLLLPIVGAVIAAVGLIKAVKARSTLKSTFASSGYFAVNSAIAIGSMLSMVGLLFIAAETWIAIKDIPKPNHPFGITEIYYYGSPEFDETALATILLPDSTLLTGAARSQINTPDGSRDYDGLLIKTTMDGREIVTKVIPKSRRPRVVATTEGMLAAMATLHDTTSSECGFIEYRKLSLNCDSLGSRLYPIGKEADVQQIILLANGQVVAMGGGKTDSTHFTWLMKTDQNGDSLWLRKYPKPAKSFFSQVIELNDNGLAMVGTLESEQDRDGEFLYAMKVDPSGNVVWENSTAASIRGGGADIVEQADGKLVVLANDWHAENGPESKLVRLNGDGTTLEDNRFGDGSFFYYSLLPTSPGDYLAVGWTPKRDPYYKLKLSSWDTYQIVEVKSDGRVMARFHGGRAMFEAWGAIQISEGTFIITGMTWRDEAVRSTMKYNRDIGILKFTRDMEVND